MRVEVVVIAAEPPKKLRLQLNAGWLKRPVAQLLRQCVDAPETVDA